GVERGAGRGAAVDELPVAQLVVVQQRVVPGGVEEVRQAGVGTGADRQELFAVLPPVLGDVRRVVDGRREVRRSLAAGGFVNRVAEPDEVIEVLGAGSRGGGWGKVGAVRGGVGAHQAVGVTSETEANGGVGRRAGRGDEGADL